MVEWRLGKPAFVPFARAPSKNDDLLRTLAESSHYVIMCPDLTTFVSSSLLMDLDEA